MKTTEKINISDSILFLGCARIALSEIALASSIKDKDSVSDFILNEASDFQVMGLLIEGENPGKYDPFKEIALFEDLKDQVLDNYFFTNEMIGEDVTNNIIHEIGAITPKGYSSAGNSIGKVSIISETKFWENVEINLSEAPTKVIDIEKGISAVKKAMSKVKDQIKDHISKGETREANFAKAKLQALQKKQDSLTYHLKQAYKLGKEKSSELAGAAVVKGKAAGVVGATKGAAALKGLPGAAAIGSKLGISSTLAGGGIALAGAVAAALLIYGSVKTYKRFFSKAAKACGGKKGAEKTTCMKKFKVEGLKAQIADLSRGLAACAKTKDPKECSKSVAGKLTTLKKKLANEMKR